MRSYRCSACGRTYEFRERVVPKCWNGACPRYGKRVSETPLEPADSGDFLDWGFSPALALDDVTGGRATQALMWATNQIPRSTEILKTSGARETDSLSQLWKVNSTATRRLIDAHLLLGIRNLKDVTADDVPTEIGDRACRIAEFRAGQAERFSPTNFVPSPFARQQGAVAQEGLREASAESRSRAEVVTRLRTAVIHRFFLEPLLASGRLSAVTFLERQFLPMRMDRGAVWDVDSGLSGGSTAAEIAQEIREAGRVAPIYLPFIPLPPKAAREHLAGAWLSSEVLVVSDPYELLGRRATEIACAVENI